MAPKARILIVDDNEMNLKVARGLLSPLQMTLETAQSGKAALEMIEDSTYDIIFMDHRMPVMDGTEAMRRIHELPPGNPNEKTPIIALTANAFDEDVQRSMQAGLDAHLSKPVESEHLFETLEQLIRE